MTTPYKTIYSLCWNYSISLIIESIIDNFAVDEMYYKYKDIQNNLCEKYNLTKSDTYFIATSEALFYKKRRRKGNTARLCLTTVMGVVNEKE